VTKRFGWFTFSVERATRPQTSVHDLLHPSGPLLPYRVEGVAWISRSVAYSGQVTITGSVTVDTSAITLTDHIGNQIAQAAPRSVTVHRVRAFMGMGVRLDMGSQGTWYVQPFYVVPARDPGVFRRLHVARKVTPKLREAIAAAQTSL
jgi:hypothetical protein